jgi:hypothetical protein
MILGMRNMPTGMMQEGEKDQMMLQDREKIILMGREDSGTTLLQTDDTMLVQLIQGERGVVLLVIPGLIVIEGDLEAGPLETDIDVVVDLPEMTGGSPIVGIVDGGNMIDAECC